VSGFIEYLGDPMAIAAGSTVVELAVFARFR